MSGVPRGYQRGTRAKLGEGRVAWRCRKGKVLGWGAASYREHVKTGSCEVTPGPVPLAGS